MRSGNWLACGLYRGVAKLSGLFLASGGFVEGVFVHRSVAAGEVAFGRSDIDLVLVVRQPDSESADGPELAALYEKVCLLRRFNPAVGHMAVQDSSGIRKLSETDTYIGSLDRRGALWLCGKPVVQPVLPVRREDAIRRFAHWHDGNLSAALRHRDSRNLRKIAADAWNTYAVATGRIQVPFLTRAQSEANWKASEGVEPAIHRTDGGSFRGFQLAKRLHDELLPPLKPLREAVTFRVRTAPKFRERVFAVIPDAASPVPPEMLASCSSLCTPELLHLYLHYANPFLDWVLPDQLRRLGFRPPAPDAFVRACRFFGHSHVTRNPGFMHGDTTAPAVSSALLQHSLNYLRDGRTPPPLPLERLDAIARHRPGCLDYYRRDFAKIYGTFESLWISLGEFAPSAGLARAAGATD